MLQKINGLLISKMKYRERDILGRVLLRNGKKVSVIFYGGAGGGTKKRSTSLEIGFLLDIELQHMREQKEANIYKTREWSLAWEHNSVRIDYKKFYLLCFFVELINIVAPEENLFDQISVEENSHESIFRLFSSAIFNLEKINLKENDSDNKLSLLLLLFIIKFVYELGIFPDLDESDNLFEDENLFNFFKECAIIGLSLKLNEVDKFEEVLLQKQSFFVHQKSETQKLSRLLFLHFCAHYNLNYQNFKSIQSVIFD